MKEILVPISPGELIDKITILRLKSERIDDPAKQTNVSRELDLLTKVCAEALPPDETLDALTQALQETNAKLWDIEDDIRLCEQDHDFGERFIALARAVYVTNDHRAKLKKDINLHCGSEIVEEKSYAGSGDT